MLRKGTNMEGPVQYEIRVAEHLDARWAKWFGGLEIIHPAGSNETILWCETVDQAQLFGVLGKIRDLGLTLISVQRQSLLGAQPAWRKDP
jgi:hypothetical protein